MNNFPESKFTQTFNPKDYESTTEEGEGEEEQFLVNRYWKFPLSPDSKDYESNIDEGEDEKFPLNRNSKFPLSLNLKDYETTIYEGEDEEFPANDNLTMNRESYFRLVLILRIMRAAIMKGRMKSFLQMIILEAQMWIMHFL